MCRPFKEYMMLVREYTREIVTFGGLAMTCYLYTDLHDLMQAQTDTSRQIATELRELNIRVMELEHQNRMHKE